MSTEERCEEILFENGQWKIVLADDQLYLGRAVVVLHRPCPSLSLVTPLEMESFMHIMRIYESSVRKAFGATMFNWGCLMNHAFQKKPYDPQVHWHVYPRYDHPVTFNFSVNTPLGAEEIVETFRDPNFGYHYRSPYEEGREVASATRVEIVRRITGIE